MASTWAIHRRVFVMAVASACLAGCGPGTTDSGSLPSSHPSSSESMGSRISECKEFGQRRLRSTVQLDKDAPRIELARRMANPVPGYDVVLARFENQKSALWAVESSAEDPAIYSLNAYARSVTPWPSQINDPLMSDAFPAQSIEVLLTCVEGLG